MLSANRRPSYHASERHLANLHCRLKAIENDTRGSELVIEDDDDDEEECEKERTMEMKRAIHGSGVGRRNGGSLLPVM